MGIFSLPLQLLYSNLLFSVIIPHYVAFVKIIAVVLSLKKAIAGAIITPAVIFQIQRQININGMVMHESKCEITAIPAASEESLPKALGITIVLSPKGIAREQRAHT